MYKSNIREDRPSSDVYPRQNQCGFGPTLWFYGGGIGFYY
jgi:hypothetical protein